MNLKVTFVGGFAYYLTTFLLSMVSGPVIHNNILLEAYKAHSGYWRPELNAVPPDMAGLMPLWITTGLVMSFVVACFYAVVRPALSGSPWQRGLKFGLGIGVLWATTYAMLFGIFNLPAQIWIWWSAEGLVMGAAGGAVLGLVAQKLSPAAA